MKIVTNHTRGPQHTHTHTDTELRNISKVQVIKRQWQFPLPLLAYVYYDVNITNIDLLPNQCKPLVHRIGIFITNKSFSYIDSIKNCTFTLKGIVQSLQGLRGGGINVFDSGRILVTLGLRPSQWRGGRGPGGQAPLRTMSQKIENDGRPQK